MKISIVVPDLIGGGAEKVAVNLANYYTFKGFSVDLVLFRLYGSYIDLVDSKVNIVNLEIKRNRYFYFRLKKYLYQNKTNYILSVKRDINIMVGLCSLGMNLKSLTFREASTYDKVKRMSILKQKTFQKILQLSYSKAQTVIANSTDTKKDIVYFDVCESDKIKIISNPVLPLGYEKLLEMQCNHKWLNDKSLKVILAVGRLEPLKNFSFLIDVFYEIHKTHKDIRLIIVGEGSERKYLLNQIKNRKLDSYIEIEKFQSNIFPYYKNADLFSLVSKWEGFGNVIVEALSAGLPVVSSNCPGGPKMILQNGKYGKLVEPENKNEYVKTLLTTLTSTNKENTSKDLMNYAAEFSVERIAQSYLEVMAK